MKPITCYYLHSNRLLLGLIGPVNDLDTITCPSVTSLGAITMEFGMDIIVTYGTFSIIYILVTTDVVGDNCCGRFGLWPFRSAAVSVCGRSGLWPFRFVAVSVCGRSGLWPFRLVAVSVVAVSVCCRYDLLPSKTVRVTGVSFYYHFKSLICLSVSHVTYKYNLKRHVIGNDILNNLIKAS